MSSSTDRSPQEFDVIVVGGGPVGENAADRAHKAGLTVSLVEHHLVGGECSFYACSPSKALLRPIHATRASQRVQGSEGARLDPAGVLARRDAWINRIGTTDRLDDSGQVGWLDHVGITLVRGTGRLAGERLVEVGDRTLRGRHAVILATGSSPFIPDIPGLADAHPWTNREATTSQRVPGRLAILGGGVVACEMAQVYAALGSEVTVLSRSSLLRRSEPFAGEAVAKALVHDGVDLRLGVSATSVTRLGPSGEVTLEVDDGSTVTADEVLVATGRVATTAGLGLDSVDAATDEHGSVVVNEHMEVSGVSGSTSPSAMPWLYAVGDVNGLALLTHMGKYQARAVGDLIGARAAGREPDPELTVPFATALGSPQVVFTDPEVSSVGLTEHEARERGIRVRVVDVPMDAAAGAGLLAEGYQGQLRVVVDEEAGVLVGATLVGQDVAELVHVATVAIVAKAPLRTLWHAVPSYPTMSEIWLRVLEAYGV
ncbi:NAD(P)/FAD-dependent oxidoreductase [Nostocoides sp. HKS02]|uniref:dihydrolipoyl dehydrogenase family protein n=1 Tax=Nostocoides sp. HKS02 TaxID=1813880 RepID=UPI0012B4AA99|nr:NAD(P)/FAD-dependent oxidoreductase [Tetrasphaera sp. HKS02]QGN56888.1 pyridine nucleotide-disulfide oxidoreductase [Tetrasphaera sp. HKS02]